MKTFTFDYVVVGGGTAGCALANKLSEDSSVSVCVIEAGPAERHPFIRIPAGFTKTVGNKNLTWTFSTEPTPHTGNRSIEFIQGRVLGGSSSVNGMVYIRGQKGDYDAWAAAGNPGWSYEDVLPYFIAMENRPSGEARFRGTSGPLTVSDLRWRDPVCAAFIAAAQENGMPINPDYNGSRQHGVAYVQTTMSRHRRVSSASAFLRPAMSRKNLTVVTGALAERILFEGKRAVGIAYKRQGVSCAAMARQEVVVSAGTLNTARLLQVSGVGDPDLLASLGVPVVAPSKGVGNNLHDHYLSFACASGRNFQSINQLAHGPRLLGQIARYFMGAQSILELPPVLIHWFEKSQPALADADIEGVFIPASNNTFDEVGSVGTSAGMTLAFWPHRPQSRGYIKATSKDVVAAPIIQPNYLQHELDRATLLAAFRRARSLLRSKAMAHYVAAETAPAPRLETDDELLDYAGRNGHTAYHFVGTAKMGPATDSMSVVDAKLRVHGVDRLRVADCSIIPQITSANTQATAMMIGLKAADMIRAALQASK
jgi:choline dehydrogenase